MSRILIADDDPQMQVALSATLQRGGYEVLVVGNGKEAIEALEAASFDLIISDQRMPEMGGEELLKALREKENQTPFVMITAYGTINQAVQAMQLGASDFLAKPFSAEDLVRVVERVQQTAPEAVILRSKKNSKQRPIVTNNPLMIRVLEVAEAVARSDATVLIQGESGTGKELIARLIHSSSPRRAQPFVAVNCAALPDTLLESELFGHEKGAFTGAQGRKIGKFELAHGGTILLDEISEMDILLQAKLLRVLQEREVDRVGGKDPVSIDVRVLATTNRNLEQMVQEGKFRADLYYRLNVIPLTVPPLRERKGDVRLLVEHFMRLSIDVEVPRLSPEVLATLEAYPWPGNVRELQNAVERAAILSQGHSPRKEDFLLKGGDLPPPHEISNENTEEDDLLDEKEEDPSFIDSSIESFTSHTSAEGMRLRAGMTVEQVEKALIIETLRSTNNNRTHAAKLLGISIRTLRNKLHEYRMEGE